MPEDSLTWDDLKRSVYYEDGSLRDIYVLNTTREDWRKWVDYVNSNCNVTWIRDESEGREPEKKIDFDWLVSCWESEGNYESHPAAILLGKIRLNVFFFAEEEIENNILPSEFQSIDDHHELMNYLKAVSKLLAKDVLLTEENYGTLEGALIRVTGDDIFLI